MLFGAAGLAFDLHGHRLLLPSQGRGPAVPDTLFLVLVLSAIGAYAMSLAPVVG